MSFKSYMMAGFECSSHRRKDGRRLDLIAATQHDQHALADYRQLAEYAIKTVRDGVRWHLIELRPGVYDWSTLEPMVEAAQAADTQVIWDLLHYGWPDWTSPFEEDFVQHFAAFAEVAARKIGPHGHYCPINEISFLAWGGGEVGYLNPFVNDRGEELKLILCRAAIAATRRIRAVDPSAVIVACEPLIAVHPADQSHESVADAAGWNRAQYDAIDCLLGRRHPELGGNEEGVDFIGVNYYPHNQWFAAPSTHVLEPAQMKPLRELLIDAARHFGRPLFISETGCEDDRRASWIAMVLDEARAATNVGHPIIGVCLYPILDHPGWDDDRVCRNGLMCGYSYPRRPAYAPLLDVILAAADHSAGPSAKIDADLTLKQPWVPPEPLAAAAYDAAVHHFPLRVAG